MTTTTHSPSHRRLDVAGAGLLLVGVLSGLLAYLFITEHGTNPLLLVPSVVAATTGALHLTKRVAARD